MADAITSLQNPRIKQVRRLRDHRARVEENRYVIDSRRDLARALAAGHQVDYVLIESSRFGTLSDVSIDAQIPVSAQALDKASYRDNNDGIAAVMMRQAIPGAAEFLRIGRVPVLALAAIEKPGNVGALLRTADAAGFGSVVLIDCPIDVYNPNVIRASTGAVFLGNVYEMTTAQAQDAFSTRGLRTYATHLDAATDAFSVQFVKDSVLFDGAGRHWPTGGMARVRGRTDHHPDGGQDRGLAQRSGRARCSCLKCIDRHVTSRGSPS
ncbi:MAG: hypothetical protein HND48_09625 [Chloroflexi bacterium]|nr:hypothetical protein [Chloroflexota bacterium]